MAQSESVGRGWRSMTDLTAEREAPRHDQGPDSGLPDRHERLPAAPSSALPGGVELTRLISLARLTPPPAPLGGAIRLARPPPARALEIGASLLGEAAGAPDTGSPDGGRVVIDQVVIDVDGRVVLGPAADGRHNGRHNGRPSAAGPSGRAVEAVLADVAGAARLRARRADPAAVQLQAELDRAGAELPVAGVPVVARMLQEAAAAIDRGAVRAELGALVQAIGGRASPVSASAPAGAPSTVVRAAPARRATDGKTTSARRRIGAWLLSILVLAAVVLLEVVVLRDRIAADIGLLLDAGRGGSTSSPAPKPDGLRIVAPAPAAAGSVSGVDLRPLTQCAPGAPCTLRLLVRVVPGADPQVVNWSYRIVDRCTGASGTTPGGSVTVPAAQDRVAVIGTVPLPALPGVAVVAVTQLPAVAASAPVLVGSCRSPPAG